MSSVKLNLVLMVAMLFVAAMAIPSMPACFTRTAFKGVVYAQGSVPISGAMVVASGSNGSGYAMTDSAGRYTITDGLRTGDYSLTVMMATGYLDLEVNNVSVEAGQETSGINFFLKRSGAISGKVTDSGGNPVKGIIVYAFPSSGNGGNFSSYALTATDGSYLISTGLPTGSYNVTAGTPFGISGETLGYIPKTMSGINLAGVQEISNVNFQLDASGSISGKVTTINGIPLADVSVSAYSTDYEYYGTAITDSSGSYKITNGLGTGMYTVLAAKGMIPSFAEDVAVTAGQETPNINFQITIPPSGSISGRVTDTSGNAIEDASVSASGATGSGTAFTDENGYYIISEGLGTGSYTVYASASGFNSSSPMTVSVTINQETTNVSFQLQKVSGDASGTISGQVTGEANPIPEFTINTVPVALSLAAVVALIASLRIRHLKKRNRSEDLS